VFDFENLFPYGTKYQLPFEVQVQIDLLQYTGTQVPIDTLIRKTSEQNLIVPLKSFVEKAPKEQISIKAKLKRINLFIICLVHILHPDIAPHQTVPILRGLPEGSRLSPTLFGLFAADLEIHLKRKFPDATILHIFYLVIHLCGGLWHRGISYFI
jgi:hypothetical protein